MDRTRPMFRADWNQALFIHLRVDPQELSRVVPFELETINGDAFISLVAFTQSNLRPVMGGKFAAMLSAPLAEHEFLNLRAYVRVNGEPAIYFISEWIPNRLAVLIGPRLYGLPYRLGHFCSTGFRPVPICESDAARHGLQTRATNMHRSMSGTVTGPKGELTYKAVAEGNPTTASPGSIDHFFLERYLAFTHRNGTARNFHVTHAPWLQCRVTVDLTDRSLLDSVGSWAKQTQLIGANFSPGVTDVTISAPQKCPDRVRFRA